MTQLHSADYRNPQALPAGPVLVVGGGNSGFQIAEELAAHPPGRPVDRHQAADAAPAAGRQGPVLVAHPARAAAGHRRLPAGPRGCPAGISSSAAAAAGCSAAGVRFRPGVADADGRTVRFADGSSLDVGVVVWATGYRSDYSWIHIPGVVREGQVVHRRGVTEVPGLYFLGLSWQHTRGSALLGFVNDDAAYLAGRIAARHQTGDLPSPHSQAGHEAQDAGGGPGVRSGTVISTV